MWYLKLGVSVEIDYVERKIRYYFVYKKVKIKNKSLIFVEIVPDDVLATIELSLNINDNSINDINVKELAEIVKYYIRKIICNIDLRTTVLLRNDIIFITHMMRNMIVEIAKLLGAIMFSDEYVVKTISSSTVVRIKPYKLSNYDAIELPMHSIYIYKAFI